MKSIPDTLEDSMFKFQLLTITAVLAIVLVACQFDTRSVAILKADNTLVLTNEVLTIDLGHNVAGMPFVLKSVPSNPPAYVSIDEISWAIKLDPNTGNCPTGSSNQQIMVQQNLAWVVGYPNTKYGGCFIQGSMTGTLSVFVGYSDHSLAVNSVKVQFVAPPN
jgi:hypothetical protein